MLEVELELKRTTCWCGTPFMLPERLLDAAINSGHTIYCLHGHTIVWQETEADKLHHERDRLKQDAARLTDTPRHHRPATVTDNDQHGKKLGND